MKMKKILAVVLVAILTITTIGIPVSASSYSSKAPYVRSWLDAINDYEVVDFYQYSSADNAYYKAGTINHHGKNAYYKTVDTPLTTNLLDEEIGFDMYGNIWFVTTDYELIYWAKKAKSGSRVAKSVSELSFDDNGFVVGYLSGGYTFLIPSDGNSGGGNAGNTDNNNNTGNTGGTGNWNDSNSSKYPYLTTEDKKLTYCESSSEHHNLYIQDGYLILNNLILYKNGVKEYGFYEGGVAFINKDNKLIIYKFGDKYTKVKSKKVSCLIYDEDGFVTSYKKSNGKKYKL